MYNIVMHVYGSSLLLSFCFCPTRPARHSRRAEPWELVLPASMLVGLPIHLLVWLLNRYSKLETYRYTFLISHGVCGLSVLFQVLYLLSLAILIYSSSVWLVDSL